MADTETLGTVLPVAQIVTPEWLVEHRDAVLVLDASVARSVDAAGSTVFAPGQTVFAEGHIPAAQFADLFDGFSDPAARYSFTAPTPEGLQAAARAVGISPDTDVVVYDQLGDAYAARVWFVLRAFGFDRVRVMTGGLTGWVAAGGMVETGAAAPIAPGGFVAGAGAKRFVSTSDVRALIAAPPDPVHPLICGLRRPTYEAGHIPQSYLMPYPDFRDSADRLDPVAAMAAFTGFGLTGLSEPVFYCGGGINSAGLALLLTEAGLLNIKIYDDSMNGWQDDPALPLERGTRSSLTDA